MAVALALPMESTKLHLAVLAALLMLYGCATGSGRTQVAATSAVDLERVS